MQRLELAHVAAVLVEQVAGDHQDLHMGGEHLVEDIFQGVKASGVLGARGEVKVGSNGDSHRTIVASMDEMRYGILTRFGGSTYNSGTFLDSSIRQSGRLLTARFLVRVQVEEPLLVEVLSNP